MDTFDELTMMFKSGLIIGAESNNNAYGKLASKKLREEKDGSLMAIYRTQK